MEPKKVLIIAYYWPPSGGSGVQRWLKFVKYLPQVGCKPYVFTPANPSFEVKDESLLKDVPSGVEVIHFPIWEPYKAFFKLSSLFEKKKTAKPTELVQGTKKSFFQKLSTWIRGNFFIPDPRVFWVKPSVSFLQDFLQEHKIQTIITTGPPHSMHLIGFRLKKKNPSLKWLADFRDPWTEWGLLDSLMVGTVARKFHKQLELKVLSTADRILTITPFYVRRFEALSGRKVNLLTNGFDEDDFKNLVYSKSDFFLIRHVGIVNEKCDPRPFMRVVREVLIENQDFASQATIEFIGEVHPQFKKFVEDSVELKSVVKFMGNIPHNQLLSMYGESSLLLLILTGYKDAEGYMPGKLFEYMATGLPILGVGPVNGDAATLLKETHAGEMLGSEDAAGIRTALLRNFEHWKNSSQSVPKLTSNEKYSRKEITRALAELL